MANTQKIGSEKTIGCKVNDTQLMLSNSIQSKHPIAESGFKSRTKELGKHLKDIFVKPPLVKELDRLRKKEGCDYINNPRHTWPYGLVAFEGIYGEALLSVGQLFGDNSHLHAIDLADKMKSKFPSLEVVGTLTNEIAIKKIGNSPEFDEAVAYLKRRKISDQFRDDWLFWFPPSYIIF